MKVAQHITAGKLTGSYMSSWNNELTLNFGDDQVTLKMGEDELRDLYERLEERIKSIDDERQEKAAEAANRAEEEEEVDA